MTLTLGEVSLCGKVAASPLALTIKPKTHTLLLVNHMKYFDVLTSHQWVGSGDKSWYFVWSVLADSEVSAKNKVKSRARRFFSEQGRELLTTVVHGVGPSSMYDKFAGKYVGQFIDEALCRK